MTSPSSLLYRMFFAVQTFGMPARVRRWPRLVRSLRGFKALVDRYALPKTPVWVRVQSGLSRGMWMQLRLPEEVRLWRGEHEIDVQGAISAVMQPGTVLYDVGSHVGSLALGAARLVGEQGRVVAFEADPDNMVNLRENSIRNHLQPRLLFVHAAVWSYSANHGIPFRRGGVRRTQGGVEAGGQCPVAGEGELITVPAVTLDDFIANGGPTPQLVKIDVEGGEYEVLRGGPKLFESQRPLIIAEVHHQRAAEQIEGWLGQNRYTAHWNIPSENFPRCLFAWPTEYDGTTWMAKRTSFRK